MKTVLINTILKFIQLVLFYIGFSIISFSFWGCNTKSSKFPILVLATDTDFGTYTGELLKTEGFNEFILDSLADRQVNKTYLEQFDLVILAQTQISQSGKELLTGYVKKGGNLIAFHPDTTISEIFGLIPARGNITEGYIGIDTTISPGFGITPTSLQFHGTANKYEVNSATIIASLFEKKTAVQRFPGVVINDYGKGHALAFLYNLPKSIVYTRQGNPLFAGIEKDGIPGIRGLDLFTNGWEDTSNNTINQADQQMALLSNCIHYMNGYSKPLPRFWYFPDTLKCLVTLTNDGEYNSETDFESQFHDVDSMGAKMSIYIIGVDKVSKEWADKWTARGFEIAGHPDDTKEAVNPGWNNMDSVIRAKKNEIAVKYGLPNRTNVNHWFVWCGKDEEGKPDFAAQAKLEEINGIELDINYAHYDIKSNQGDHFLGPLGTKQGNFTGSGLVMKFADVNGKIINVYQHLNAVYDQEYNESHDPEGFYDCFKGLMDRSLHSEVYSFISVKSHNDEYYFSKTPLMKMLAYANSNGIPVWTEVNLLDFLKMKDEASFTNISWTNNQLSYTLNSYLKHVNGLSFMIPANFGGKKVKGIIKDGKDTQFTIKSVKGSNYAFVTVEPGKKYKISVEYTQ